MSVRSEEKKQASTTEANAMAVSIKKIPTGAGSSVETEDLPQPDKTSKVVLAPEIPSVSPVSMPAESLKSEVFPKPSIEPSTVVIKKEEIPEKPEAHTPEVKHDEKEEKKVSESAVKMTGFVDFYYQYNSNTPAVPTGAASKNQFIADANNPYRLFDYYHDNFTLNLAQLSFKKETEKVGGRVDLGFGSAMSAFSPLDGATQNVIQAKVFYKFGEKYKLTVGKMISHLGAEEPYAIENMNYSRSLLFTYAIPLWHTGAAFEMQFIPNKFAMTLYSYNTWAGVYNNNSKPAGIKFTYLNPDRWTLNYNFISDTLQNSQNQVRQIHEVNYSLKINEHSRLLVDSVSGYQTRAITAKGLDGIWNATSVGGEWKKDHYILSPRLEYFSDPQGFAFSNLSLFGANANTTFIPQNIMSLTLTNTWLFEEGGKMIFELRQDSSDVKVFTGFDNKPTQSQTTGTFAFLFDF